MGKLINKKSLINKLAKAPQILCNDKIIQLIKEEPTAYDVDKVVEQLEILKNGYNFMNSGYSAGEKVEAVDDAISIITEGAVKDE